MSVSVSLEASRIMATRAAELRTRISTPSSTEASTSSVASTAISSSIVSGSVSSGSSNSRDPAHVSISSRALVPYVSPGIDLERQQEAYRRSLSTAMTAHRLLSGGARPSSTPVPRVKLAFPFAPAMPCRPEDYRAVGKRCTDIYNACRSGHGHDPDTYATWALSKVTTVDLRNKGISWRIGPQSFDMRRMAVEHFRENVCSRPRYRQVWKFDILVDGHPTREAFFLSGRKKIHEQCLPLTAFAGNECEVQPFPCRAPFSSSEYWDSWKSDSPDAIDNYRGTIYPLFEEGLARVSASLGHRDLSLADVGGGDGELAFQLATQCPQVKKAYIVDSSVKAIALTTRRKDCSCPFNSPETRAKVEVIAGDITKINFLEALNYEEMDVIVLSGVVAYQVLMREESIKLLQKCKQFLKDDGFILIASHSACRFNKADFERLGFEVVNMSATILSAPSAEPSYTVEPFYALRVR